MNKIQNKELYKYKAEKYYQQYLNIKNKSMYHKLSGGSAIKPDWYDNYLKEINAIYDDIFIITGSGAVSIYLNYFNNLTGGKFNNLIPNLRIPNDADFLYYCKGSNYESRRKIKKYSRLQDSPQRSVTYEFNDLGIFPTYIKSFDLTCLPKINYVNIDKYKLLSLEKLLDIYSQELEDFEMFLRNYHDTITEIEKNIEKSKKESSPQLLDLEEEYGEILNKSEQTNNKILTLNLKINIINTLIDNIKIDSIMSSSYNIVYLPTIPETTKKGKRDVEDVERRDAAKHIEDDTSDDDITKKPRKDYTQKSIFQRLFSSDSVTDVESDSKSEPSSLKKTPLISKKMDFGDEIDDITSSPGETPLITKKLDFGDESDDADDADDAIKPTLPFISKKLDFSSGVSPGGVREVPYNIRFSFEK
jgi:hypothetical protein